MPIVNFSWYNFNSGSKCSKIDTRWYKRWKRLSENGQGYQKIDTEGFERFRDPFCLWQYRSEGTQHNCHSNIGKQSLPYFCLLSDNFPVFQTSGKVEVLSGINGVIICQFIVPIQSDASPCLVKLPTFSIKHTQGPAEGSPEMKDAVQVGTSLKVC